MLRKKVLFVMDPPLRALCLHVYAAGFLTRHQVKTLQRKIPDPRLLFYVNITQTRMVLGQKDYIACTTERIFEVQDLPRVLLDFLLIMSFAVDKITPL
jgi:hypothetical protein